MKFRDDTRNPLPVVYIWMMARKEMIEIQVGFTFKAFHFVLGESSNKIFGAFFFFFFHCKCGFLSKCWLLGMCVNFSVENWLTTEAECQRKPGCLLLWFVWEQSSFCNTFCISFLQERKATCSSYFLFTFRSVLLPPRSFKILQH